MKTNKWKLFLNPFQVIAGYQALGLGAIGILLSSVLNFHSHYHYHGLLHYGIAPDAGYTIYLAEALIVWLIPSFLFYLGGLVLSKSKIRVNDVFGTVAFAQLPFVLMSACYFLPSFQRLLKMNLDADSITKLMTDPVFMLDLLVSSASVIFLIWMLVWMFQALKVSCNLKGVKLGACYAVAVIGGDILCRMVIRLLH